MSGTLGSSISLQTRRPNPNVTPNQSGSPRTKRLGPGYESMLSRRLHTRISYTRTAINDFHYFQVGLMRRVNKACTTVNSIKNLINIKSLKKNPHRKMNEK